MKLENFYTKKNDRVLINATLEDVVDKMNKESLRYIVIVDSNNFPLGILTERDILSFYNSDIDLSNTNAYEVSAKQLVQAHKYRELEYALNFMVDHNIRRVIVVDEEEKYLGVVEQEEIIFEFESNSTRSSLKIFEVLLNESEAFGVQKDTTLEETISLMKERNFGAILVYDGNKSIGILTESDILILAREKISKKLSVENFMQSPVFTVSIQESIHDCVELMREKSIRRVIVKDIAKNGEEINYIITTKDILNNLQGNYSKFLEAKLKSQRQTFESLEDILIEVYDFGDSQVISWINKAGKEKLKVKIDESIAKLIPSKILTDSLICFERGESFNCEKVEIKGRFYRYNASCISMYGTKIIKILLSDFTDLYLANLKLIEQVDVMSDSISEQESMQRQIFNQHAIGIGYMSENGQILFTNSYVYELLGYKGDELTGMHIDDITFEEDLKISSKSRKVVLSTTDKGNEQNFDKRYKHKDGYPIWVNVSMSTSKSAEGGINYIIGFIKDITERKNTEKSLLLSGVVFDNTNEGIVIVDKNFKIQKINNGFTKILGYSEEEVYMKNVDFFAANYQHKNFYKKMLISVVENDFWQGEVWGYKKNGVSFPQWLNINTIRNEKGEVINYIGIFSDISEVKKSAEKLDFLAHHDPLTKLPNRLLLNSSIDHAIKRAKRENTKVAVLFLDLDRFKEINDTFGHSFGDTILITVSNRLKAIVREQDIIARIGGDEFVILLEDLDHIDNLESILEKVLGVFEEEIFIQKNIFKISSSIGISIFPDDGYNIEVLVKNADVAMYQAKEAGRNTYKFYTEQMTEELLSKMFIKNELEKAIKNDEFVLHYQPQVSLENKKVLGAEALVRWEHPTLGLLYPDKFIEIAEQTKQIVDIGKIVLTKACRDIEKLIRTDKYNGRVSVNVSVEQIKNGDFYDVVIAILKETGLDGKFLDLELTESYMLENPEEAISLFEKLQRIGVTLSIDDFGTGYSSLSYLKKLPVDKLKIDRSFIMDVPGDKEDMAITSTIIAMAKNLGINVIAEGIETIEQHNFLKEKKCYEGQGYLYSKPIALEKFIDFLRTN